MSTNATARANSVLNFLTHVISGVISLSGLRLNFFLVLMGQSQEVLVAGNLPKRDLTSVILTIRKMMDTVQEAPREH